MLKIADWWKAFVYESFPLCFDHLGNGAKGERWTDEGVQVRAGAMSLWENSWCSQMLDTNCDILKMQASKIIKR